MKKTALLLLFIIFTACAFAQINAVDAGYSTLTKYRTLIKVPSDTTPYKPLSKTQDKLFVFFNKYGKLTASQPKGVVKRFTWQKLDTATLTFNTFFIDSTFTGGVSKLKDSVGYGCYRVATDTLQGLTRVAADTFNTWVIIDTFRVDSIVKVSQDCNFLALETLFYPNNSNAYSFFGFKYQYLDLWHTPKKVKRYLPDTDCNSCLYLQNAKWEPSTDIYEGTDGADESWKTQYSPYISTPYHNAKYKIVAQNYFGNQDTFSTALIEARSTFAKMKLFTQKTKNGNEDWEEKTDESGEDAPLTIKLANASINANSNATFTWSLFYNLYELPDDIMPDKIPLLVPQIITTDSAATVEPKKYNNTLYQPGKYPILLQVVNKYGCTGIDSTTLEVNEFLISKDAMPTVFTPNNDGKNDVVQLKDPDNNVHSLESIEVNIFNRYGQLMFSSHDVMFSWDGKIKGTNTPAHDGVYFYVIKAQGHDKQRKKINQTLKGSIHLFDGK